MSARRDLPVNRKGDKTIKKGGGLSFRSLNCAAGGGKRLTKRAAGKHAGRFGTRGGREDAPKAQLALRGREKKKGAACERVGKPARSDSSPLVWQDRRKRSITAQQQAPGSQGVRRVSLYSCHIPGSETGEEADHYDDLLAHPAQAHRKSNA